MNWIRGRPAKIEARLFVPPPIPLDNPRTLGLEAPGDGYSDNQAMIDYAMSFPNQHPTMIRLFGEPGNYRRNRRGLGF